MGENSTPGPWMLQPMANGARVLGGRHLRIVAHIPAQREADARLIAAAPVLLEAVKGAIDYLCGATTLTPAEVTAQLWAAYKAAAGDPAAWNAGAAPAEVSG